MSEEATRAFVERMKDDPDFKARVMAVERVEARVELINAEGFDCTADEIEAHATRLGDAELGQVVAGEPEACGAAACGAAVCGTAACGPAVCGTATS